MINVVRIYCTFIFERYAAVPCRNAFHSIDHRKSLIGFSLVSALFQYQILHCNVLLKAL